LVAQSFTRFHLDVGFGDVAMQPLMAIESSDWLGFTGIAAPQIWMISKERSEGNPILFLENYSFFARAKSSFSKAEATISVSVAGIPRAVASCLHPETALATSLAICRAFGGARRK
jgi:hypothetical protein